jgi:hypothetical protein
MLFVDINITQTQNIAIAMQYRIAAHFKFGVNKNLTTDLHNVRIII